VSIFVQHCNSYNGVYIVLFGICIKLEVKFSLRSKQFESLTACSRSNAYTWLKAGLSQTLSLWVIDTDCVSENSQQVQAYSDYWLGITIQSVLKKNESSTVLMLSLTPSIRAVQQSYAYYQVVVGFIWVYTYCVRRRFNEGT